MYSLAQATWDAATIAYDEGKTSEELNRRADVQQQEGKSVTADFTRAMAAIVRVWEMNGRGD